MSAKNHGSKLVLPLVLLLLIIACGGSATTASQEGTASNTPNPPTATSAPVNTPTTAPTATLDAVATVAAQSTQAAGDVFAEVNELLGDSDVPYQDGHLIWRQNDPISIKMQGPSGSNDTFAEIDPNLTSANFIFKSEVTWEASGWMYCGAVLRSEEPVSDGKQYQFYFLRFSGSPSWYIDVYENDQFLNSITGEQFSQEIVIDNGATNTFVVVAQDEMFIVYFNGERQGRFFDNSQQRTDGLFGFFGWQESGTGSCTYENSWIWSLDK